MSIFILAGTNPLVKMIFPCLQQIREQAICNMCTSTCILIITHVSCTCPVWALIQIRIVDVSQAVVWNLFLIFFFPASRIFIALTDLLVSAILCWENVPILQGGHVRTQHCCNDEFTWVALYITNSITELLPNNLTKKKKISGFWLHYDFLLR